MDAYGGLGLLSVLDLNGGLLFYVLWVFIAISLFVSWFLWRLGVFCGGFQKGVFFVDLYGCFLVLWGYGALSFWCCGIFRRLDTC